MLKVGDLVIVLYEKISYNLIVAEGQTRSSWVILDSKGKIRSVPTLELKSVSLHKHREVTNVFL